MGGGGGGGGGYIVCFPNTLCDCLLAVLPVTMYIFGQRGWGAVGVEASRKFFMKGFFFYFFSFPFFMLLLNLEMNLNT